MCACVNTQMFVAYFNFFNSLMTVSEFFIVQRFNNGLFQIVDMALIVKRDKNVTLGDPFSHEMAPVCMNYETLAPKTSESAVVGGGSLLSPSLSSTNALMVCSFFVSSICGYHVLIHNFIHSYRTFI